MGRNSIERHQIKTAILVDGGFYRKRAAKLFGYKSPSERADELVSYCFALLSDKYENRYLYRIFYYDCPPVDKNVFHPLLQKNVDLGKTEEFYWANEFFKELKHRRKFALRMGEINKSQIYYAMKPESTKKLMNGSISQDQLSEEDFMIHLEQKGVDMRIGVDIASLAFKKQVNQIILISGDSDFVPAAKQARREGIDFILDPMGMKIKDNLYEHIDGIRSKIKKFTPEKNESSDSNSLMLEVQKQDE